MLELEPRHDGFAIYHLAHADASGMDVLHAYPTPDDADALADAIHEWAALARARERSNAGPGPLLVLMGVGS